MKLTPYWLMSLSFIGLGDTAYLAYFHIIGKVPSCAILNGCEQVLNSPYSMPFGIPFSYLGIVFYSFMLFISILLAIDPMSKGLRFGVLAYTAFALLLSIGFELFQIMVIRALCLYCAISALTTLLLFGVALWHFRTTKELKQ